MSKNKRKLKEVKHVEEYVMHAYKLFRKIHFIPMKNS